MTSNSTAMTQEIEIIEVSNQYKRKSKPRLIALEPRMLFDGAAVITIAESQAPQDQAPQPSLDQAIAPEALADALSNPIESAETLASTDSIMRLVSIDQPAASDRKELVVVDGKLDDLQSLLDDIARVDPNRTVLVLDPSSDESAQLIHYLNQQTVQYDAIHLLSHGGEGWISLGTEILDLRTPEQNAAFWQAVKAGLTDSGDVLLYACNIISNSEGKATLDALATFTDADIAASINTTGISGDWILEATTGSIEAPTIVATSWESNLVDPIVVADINVNEASPYAVFTVDGGYGASVKLNLVSDTAVGGATDNGTNDFSTSMEYWNGSSWNAYTSGSTITIPADTDLLVRVALYRQTVYEGPESFTLRVLNSSNVLQDSAVATIKDDGTGNIFTGETTPTDDSAAYAAAVAAGASTAEKQAALDAWRTASFEKSRVIISSFHIAFYLAEGGGYYVSGENAGPNGSTELTTPLLITPANGYNYTGTIIDVAIGSGAQSAEQMVLLTTEGLYVWGVASKAVTSTGTSFQKISTPADFIFTDVQSMTATNGGVMFLMKDGTVRSSVTTGASGHPSTGNFTKVVDVNNVAIAEITDLEFSSKGAFAYSTSTGKFYTWGSSIYLGNGSAAANYTKATEMLNPLPQGESVVQIGMSDANYYVLGTDGKVYVCGINTNGELGLNSTTAVLSWTAMRDTTGAAGTSLTNVQFISAQNSTSGNRGAVGMILKDGSVLVAGYNGSNMLGISPTSDVLKPTAPSGSIANKKAYTIEVGSHFSSVLLYGCTGVVSASGHNPGGAFGDGSLLSRTEYEETLFLGALDTACIEPVVLANPTLAQLADDRPLGVNDLNINEGSPYAVFTVTGTAGRAITLALANGTASSSDYGSSLEIFNGTEWVPYLDGNSVQIPSGGLLVRVAVVNDSQADGGETFTLTASSAGTPSATGTATIKDDGTGDIYSGTSGAADTNVSAGSLDYDRNDAPAGTDKTITLNEDATHTLSAADFGFTDPNDTPANTLQSVIIASLPGAGTLTLNGTAVTVGQVIPAASIANLVYAPAANANGTSYASFTFKVVDDGGTANSGENTDQSANTITFNVTAVNDPPVDANETNTVTEDTTLTVAAGAGLLVNTTDIDGGAASITAYTVDGVAGTPTIGSSFTIPGVGALTINSDGSYSFVPVANYTGAIPVITYTVSDGAGGTDTSTLTLSMSAVNDAPAGTDKTITLNEDATHTLSAADFGFTDPNDTPANTLQSVIIASLPGAGTLTLNGTAVTVGQVIPAASIANLVYAPAANANGTSYASFTFKVVDDGGTANSGENTDQSANTITFNVTAVNDPPVDANETNTVTEDTTLTVAAGAGLLVNTTDIDGGAASITAYTVDGVAGTPTIGSSFTIPGVGALTINSDGSYSFVPVANYTGAIPVITYTVSDGAGGTDTSTLTLSMSAVNDAPAGTDKTITLNEDATHTLSAADFGFTDPNDTPANTLQSVIIASLPGAGTLTLNGTAVTVGQVIPAASIANLVYAPAANANGTSYASFTFKVVDDGGTANSGENTDQSANTITFNVTAVNDPPVDANETNTVTEDTTLTVAAGAGLLVNTTDIDGGAASITAYTVDGVAGTPTIGSSFTIPGVGALTINSDGSYSFVPVANYTGAIPVITYTVSDGAGGTDTSTLTLSMSAVNDAPVAVDDPYTMLEDGAAITLTPLTSDTDVENNTLTITSINGTTLTPGTAQTISVTGGTVNVSTTGVITFTPASNFNGVVTIPYVISDGAGGTATANEIITVTAVNDAPVGTDKDISVLDGGSYTFAANDFGFTDPNDTPANALQSVIISSLPSLGTLTLNGTAVTVGQVIPAASIANLVYAPAANASGYNYADFTFKVVDNGGTANSGQNTDQSANVITINISGIRDDNETKSVAEDSALTVDAATGLLANTSYIGAGSIAISAYSINGVTGTPTIGNPFTIPNVGELTINANGAFTFTPVLNYNGTVPTITYSLSDDGGATVGDTSTLIITVTPVDDLFTDNDETVITLEDTAVSGSVIDTGLTSSDGSITLTSFQVANIATVYTAGQTATITNVGTIVIASNGSYTFTPVPNYNGTVPTITYSLSDDGGATVGDTSTLAITVTAVNDAPAGTDKTITLNEDATHTLSAADFGFTDPNDTPANTLQSVIIASLPGAGTLTLNGTAVTVGQVIPAASIANLVYAPAANANGTSYASFTFKVVDDGGTANSGENTDQSANTITFNVTAVNDPPVDANETNTVTEDTTLTVAAGAGLLVNTTDIDGGAASITAYTVDGVAGTPTIGSSFTIPGVGALTINSDGSYSFVPVANYTGAIPVITYTVSDGAGGTDTSTLTLTMLPVDDPFTDNNEVVTTLEDTAVSGNVIDGTSVDGPITVTSFQVAGSATVYTAGQTATIIRVDPPATTASPTIVNVGTITIAANGAYTFTPAANYNGTVPTVTYSLSDDSGATVGDTSTLIITVTPVNDPPIDGDEDERVEKDTILIVTAAGGLLANGYDVEGSSISITQFTVNGVIYPVTANAPGVVDIAGIGKLTIHSDGSYRYEPVAGYTGAIPVTTYVISDGNGGFDTSTLTLRVPSIVPPTRIVGQTPFMPQMPLYQPIEMGKYEFHTVVLDFNGQSGGINQFSLPTVESTVSRGNLQYSNHTPYYSFDRVGDEVRNAQRSIDANLSLPKESDTGLRNPLLPPDAILDSAGKVSYTIPPATFVGGKGDIQIKVFTKDGKPLPDWIKFDPAKGKLDVTMPDGVKEPVELQVVATDSKGDQAKTKLVIKPSEKPAQKTEFKGKPSLSSQIKSALMLRG